jgi:glycosyltransferase involved in cell wall biosynthesis
VTGLHVDLSELIKAPLRTGIQRVEREFIRYWPGERPVPTVIDGRGRLRAVPAQALDFLIEEGVEDRMTREEETAKLASFVEQGEFLDDSSVGTLLNLELFFDPVRAAAHRRLVANGVKVAWYVHDFIPYLIPRHFGQGSALYGMHYLRALRDVGERLSFNSPHSREDCALRILRQPEKQAQWPVFPCGADGLRLERQRFDADRRIFVSIGSIEQRKNTMSLLLAFEQLWAEGVDAKLVLAGNLRKEEVRARDFIERHADNPHFEFLREPSDETLRERLREARAVVMPSEVEGFGLPPFEAVFCGIPAIMSAIIPSADLIPRGVIKLERADPPSLAAAVRSMMDDEAASRLWESAADVDLPTWRHSTEDLAAWVRAI